MYGVILPPPSPPPLLLTTFPFEFSLLTVNCTKKKSKRIPALLHIPAPFSLRLMMHGIQIGQQDGFISLLALVGRDVVCPAPDGGGQSAGDMFFAGEVDDGDEIRPDGEDDGAGARQTAEGLSFAAEEDVVDVRWGWRAAGRGMGPAGTVVVRVRMVLGSNGAAPSEVIVELDEVVVSNHGCRRLEPTKQVQHALFEFRLVLRHGARGVDVRE